MTGKALGFDVFWRERSERHEHPLMRLKWCFSRAERETRNLTLPKNTRQRVEIFSFLGAKKEKCGGLRCFTRHYWASRFLFTKVFYKVFTL